METNRKKIWRRNWWRKCRPVWIQYLPVTSIFSHRFLKNKHLFSLLLNVTVMHLFSTSKSAHIIKQCRKLSSLGWEKTDVAFAEPQRPWVQQSNEWRSNFHSLEQWFLTCFDRRTHKIVKGLHGPLNLILIDLYYLLFFVY